MTGLLASLRRMPRAAMSRLKAVVLEKSRCLRYDNMTTVEDDALPSAPVENLHGPDLPSGVCNTGAERLRL